MSANTKAENEVQQGVKQSKKRVLISPVIHEKLSNTAEDFEISTDELAELILGQGLYIQDHVTWNKVVEASRYMGKPPGDLVEQIVKNFFKAED